MGGDNLADEGIDGRY